MKYIKERIPLVLVMVLLSGTVLFSTRPCSQTLNNWRNEPNGFRGIKWGTNISDCKDMLVEQSYVVDTIYTRQGDKNQIGEAQLKKIEYGFWRGKLLDVTIITEGERNWINLKDACFKKFGEGLRATGNIERYCWFGDTTSMKLEYDAASKQGKLYMLSQETYNQKKKYKEQQEVTKDDF